MGYSTEYKPEGYGHPWQRVRDDVKALRLFIERVATEFETRPAWIVTETGNGQRFTAFSDETAAGNFADKVRAGLPEKEAEYGGLPRPRVLVNRVAWPVGSRTATVLSYLDDSVTEDFILCLPPCPAVAFEVVEFRDFTIGGVDDISLGYAMPLVIDGDTAEGGW